MPPAEVSQFSLLISAPPDDPAGGRALEELTQELRVALADAGVVRLDHHSGGTAPEGSRGVDVLAAFTFVITAVQTAEALAKVVAAIRACLSRYAEYRHAVKLRAAGVDFDLATAAEVEPIVAALLSQPARPLTGVRRALVVANAEYEDATLARLRGPTRDADALARVLGDAAIGGFDVDLLMDADERTVRRRISAFFAGRDRDDLLLLHFSCHGVKDTRGRLYLAARDTELAALGATGIPASFINDQMDQTQSRRVVLVLDCCYSGAFGRGAAVRADRAVHLGEEFGAGTGRIVLTASSATEYAFEGTDVTHSDGHASVFTTALVNGLATGEADLDADGEISIDELYDYTYRQVRQHTPDQTPMKWSFGVEGSLSVARSVRRAALPATIVDDLASDRVVLRLEAVAALRQLLAGPSPALADSSRAELRRVADQDDSFRVRAAARAALGLASETPAPAAEIPAPPAETPAPPVETPATPVETPATPVETPTALTAAPSPTAQAIAAPVTAAQPTAAPAKAAPADVGQPPALPGSPVVAHPRVLAVVVFAAVVSLVQYIQMHIVGTDARGYAGVNALVVVPVFAAAAAVTAYRVRDWRWTFGMALLFVVSTGFWASAYFSRFAYTPEDVGWLVKAVSIAHPYVGGNDESDLLIRFLIGVPALFWYAMFGPVAPSRRRLAVRWIRHPELLATSLVALVLSLVGAQIISDGYHGSDAVFHLFGPAYRGNSYSSRAIVGLGNVWVTYSLSLTIGTALWGIGWLILTAAVVNAGVSAVRYRRFAWLSVALAALVLTIVVGVVIDGFYPHDRALELARGLALMSLPVGVGAIALTWYGPKPRQRADR